MDIEKIKKLINKDIDSNERRNKEYIIRKISEDEEEFLFFLDNVDEICFNYLIDYFDKIILKFYSEPFVGKLKKIINKRGYYNPLNINDNISLKINEEAND